MPWICKVKSPWGDKGGPVPDNFKYGFDLVRFENFPDLFEFVEEKSDEETFIKYCASFQAIVGECYYITVCRELIRLNAIKPEFLEKLRRGECL